MPNSQDPHPFTDADVFVKRGSALRSQMDDSISRHKSRVANDKKHALRFTIRDLFWLTVVVALALGWWVMAESQADQMQRTLRHAEALRQALYNAAINQAARDEGQEGEMPVDWELATREIP